MTAQGSCPSIFRAGRPNIDIASARSGHFKTADVALDDIRRTKEPSMKLNARACATRENRMMKLFQSVTCFIALLGMASAVQSADAAQPNPPPGGWSGVHGFDFEVGSWSVHLLVKRATGGWFEFEGTCITRLLMS